MDRIPGRMPASRRRATSSAMYREELSEDAHAKKLQSAFRSKRTRVQLQNNGLLMFGVKHAGKMTKLREVFCWYSSTPLNYIEVLDGDPVETDPAMCISSSAIIQLFRDARVYHGLISPVVVDAIRVMVCGHSRSVPTSMQSVFFKHFIDICFRCAHLRYARECGGSRLESMVRLSEMIIQHIHAPRVVRMDKVQRGYRKLQLYYSVKGIVDCDYSVFEEEARAICAQTEPAVCRANVVMMLNAYRQPLYRIFLSYLEESEGEEGGLVPIGHTVEGTFLTGDCHSSAHGVGSADPFAFGAPRRSSMVETHEMDEPSFMSHRSRQAMTIPYARIVAFCREFNLFPSMVDGSFLRSAVRSVSRIWSETPPPDLNRTMEDVSTADPDEELDFPQFCELVVMLSQQTKDVWAGMYPEEKLSLFFIRIDEAFQSHFDGDRFKASQVLSATETWSGISLQNALGKMPTVNFIRERHSHAWVPREAKIHYGHELFALLDRIYRHYCGPGNEMTDGVYNKFIVDFEPCDVGTAREVYRDIKGSESEVMVPAEFRDAYSAIMERRYSPSDWTLHQRQRLGLQLLNMLFDPDSTPMYRGATILRKALGAKENKRSLVDCQDQLPADVVRTRVNVGVDVFLGPVQVAHLSSLVTRRGFIKYFGDSGEQMTDTAATICYEQVDQFTQKNMLRHIGRFEDAVNMLYFLLKMGYDAAVIDRGRDFRAIKRCWRILDPADESTIGAFWDTGGKFKYVVPRQTPATSEHPEVTVSIYNTLGQAPSRLSHVVENIFETTRTLREFRERVVGAGCLLESRLYGNAR